MNVELMIEAGGGGMLPWRRSGEGKTSSIGTVYRILLGLLFTDQVERMGIIRLVEIVRERQSHRAALS